MKNAAWAMLLLVSLVLVFGYVGEFGRGQMQAVAAPPLSLDGYLDEKLPDAAPHKSKSKVDNQPCYVCHGNYDGEELVKTHAKEKIACIDCHGESHAHRNDEDNITPPDKMYCLADVDKLCAKCHKNHDVPAREVLQLWQQRCRAKTDPKQIVCTDCHFQHRLRFRTVWWDKKTGKLVIRDKQRVKLNPDYSRKRLDAKPPQPSKGGTPPGTKMR